MNKYSYSINSKSKLNTCHEDIIILFNELIKYVDITIVYGHRTPEEQHELYCQGRTTEGNIVTYKDGYVDKSLHNYLPSLAIDAIPYIKGKNVWEMKETLYYFAGYVKATADQLYSEGKMSNRIKVGADWNGNNNVNDETFVDICHFQIQLELNDKSYRL